MFMNSTSGYCRLWRICLVTYIRTYIRIYCLENVMEDVAVTFSPIFCMCDFFCAYIGVSTKAEYRLSIILFLFLILIYILSNLMNLWADRFPHLQVIISLVRLASYLKKGSKYISLGKRRFLFM